MSALSDANILGRAIALAADLHKDDTYGDGPYIFHLMQVLKTVQSQGECLEVQVAAILHDAIENHPDRRGSVVSFVTSAGLDVPSMMDTLQALARRYFDPEETYYGYINRLISDPHAALVKLADLQRNAAPKPSRDAKYARLALDRYIPAMTIVTRAVMGHKDRSDE